ncbi:GtrA family protein [Metabacillus arenae]|uniref:GtrA family protein n=1 Tax=Metabacillus arenae TaxID=2771434 RepID=A0A926NCJ3_9BACI|nr:GtrA family protein [Metabacillus arenae]MBD1381757.1 GtrA family protein [Metabacillus arenae]
MRLENYLKQMDNSFFRFLLVGIINTVFGLSTIFFLMKVCHLSYWVSTFTGNAAGGVLSFLLNRSFTFESQTSFKKGLPRFVIVVFSCYFVAFSGGEYAAIWLKKILDLIPVLTHDILAVLVGTLLYTLLNFLGQKYFVFKYHSS